MHAQYTLNTCARAGRVKRTRSSGDNPGSHVPRSGEATAECDGHARAPGAADSRMEAEHGTSVRARAHEHGLTARFDACEQMDDADVDDMLGSLEQNAAIVPAEAELADRFGTLAIETAATRPTAPGEYPEEAEDGHELRTISVGEITKMIGIERADLTQCAPHASGLDEEYGCDIFGYNTTATNRAACVTLLVRAEEGIEIPGGTEGVYGMKCLGVLEHEGEINIAALWEVVSNRVACVMAIYPTRGVDAACMDAQAEWLQQQRVTYGTGDEGGQAEEDDAGGGLQMAEASQAEAPKPRPKGWRLTVTLRELGKGFPSDTNEQHAEMLRLQDEITAALWKQMRIEAWQKDQIEPRSLSHLTPNALNAVTFHLGSMNRWEAAMPIRATKCGDVPSVRNDPNEMGVWLDVKLRKQPDAEPTTMRLKVTGGDDAQVEIERAHLCAGNLVEDHAPLQPCPGRMFVDMLGRMKASDGSRMMFREFYERTCDEADADGGPGGSTKVCPMAVAYTVAKFHKAPGAGTWRQCPRGRGCSQNLMCGGLVPDIANVVTEGMAQRLLHTYEINQYQANQKAMALVQRSEAIRRAALGGGIAKTRTVARGKGNAWGKRPEKGGGSGKGNAWGKRPEKGGGSGGKGRTWAAAWDAPSPPNKDSASAERSKTTTSGSSSARTGLEARLGPDDEKMGDGDEESEEEDGEVKNNE